MACNSTGLLKYPSTSSDWTRERVSTVASALTTTGLVAASVPLVGRHLSPWNVQAWVWAAVGCAVAGFVTSLPPLVQSTSAMWLMGSGMLAICAMLLPGISGSFLLLILGAYAPVPSAIKSFDVPKIGAFGVGAVVGLLVQLRRFQSATAPAATLTASTRGDGCRCAR